MRTTSRSTHCASRLHGPFVCAALLAVALGFANGHLRAQAQYDPTKVPSFEGIWDGTTRAHPVNSETQPWGKDNFPELNERANEYYQTGVERAADLAARSKETVSDLAARSKETVNELTSRGKETVADLTERSKELVNRQKSQIQAALEAGKQGYLEAKQSDQSKAAFEENV